MYWLQARQESCGTEIPQAPEGRRTDNKADSLAHREWPRSALIQHMTCLKPRQAVVPDQIRSAAGCHQRGAGGTGGGDGLESAVTPPAIDEYVVVTNAVNDEAAVHCHVIGPGPMAQNAQRRQLREQRHRALSYVFQSEPLPFPRIGRKAVEIAAHHDSAAVRLREVNLSMRVYIHEYAAD